MEITKKSETESMGKGIIRTIEAYESLGWQIDCTQDPLINDYIYAPSGRAFKVEDLIFSDCSFCEQQYEESYCVHTSESLDEEREAKNLLRFIFPR